MKNLRPVRPIDSDAPLVRVWICHRVDERGDRTYALPEEEDPVWRARIPAMLDQWFEMVDERETRPRCNCCHKDHVEVGVGLGPVAMAVVDVGGMSVALALCEACAGRNEDELTMVLVAVTLRSLANATAGARERA